MNPRAARRPVDVVLALAAGALFALPVVVTAAWPLQLLCLVWLSQRLAGASVRQAALLGWLFSAAWIGVSVWWLFISLHRFGGLPAALAVLAVAALAALLALYLAGAMAVFAWARSGHRVRDALLFAACWLLAELARAWIFTGFPWAATGYGQVDAPLAALAPWVGVYGMGFAAAALAGGLGLSWTHARARAMAAALLVVALLGLQVMGPTAHTRNAGSLSVTLLQTNVAQDEKFVQEHLPQALTWLGEQLLAARGALVVAPETAIPLLPEQLGDLAPGYVKALREHFSAPGRAALVGVPLGDERVGYTNSVLAWSAAGEYRYDKVHLVPFGEFIPRGFRWFTDALSIPLGDFARGLPAAPSFAFAGQRIAPNICYEDLYGEELAARFADPVVAPTLFVNVSNIAWFGDSFAVEQHLNISRLRALEFQRPMLRATNTGATAVIDHQGVVRAALAPHTQGVLDAEVQGREGITPFAAWAARAGLAPLLALALLIVVLVRLGTQRARVRPGGHMDVSDGG